MRADAFHAMSLSGASAARPARDTSAAKREKMRFRLPACMPGGRGAPRQRAMVRGHARIACRRHVSTGDELNGHWPLTPPGTGRSCRSTSARHDMMILILMSAWFRGIGTVIRMSKFRAVSLNTCRLRQVADARRYEA